MTYIEIIIMFLENFVSVTQTSPSCSHQVSERAFRNVLHEIFRNAGCHACRVSNRRKAPQARIVGYFGALETVFRDTLSHIFQNSEKLMK